MMITDNFSHDDLHPGNVLVRWAPLKRPVPQWIDWAYRFITGTPQEKPDTVPPPPGMSPQLVILDAGLVTQLNRKDWQNFVDLFKAVITYNSERAARLMIERAPRRVATREQEVDKTIIVAVLSLLLSYMFVEMLLVFFLVCLFNLFFLDSLPSAAHGLD